MTDEVVEEVKKWLIKADHMDLARLARIEGNVVNKFPEFNSFEEFGYGSFLKFLSSHEELQEAIEQVGGLGRSEGKGKRLGYPVPLGSVLDFVSQYGTQSSHVSEMCVRFREICLNIYCAFQNVCVNITEFASIFKYGPRNRGSFVRCQ